MASRKRFGNSLGDTEKNNKILQSFEPVTRPRFEPYTNSERHTILIGYSDSHPDYSSEVLSFHRFVKDKTKPVFEIGRGSSF
jgi:hypothetical protein